VTLFSIVFCVLYAPSIVGKSWKTHMVAEAKIQGKAQKLAQEKLLVNSFIESSNLVYSNAYFQSI
jgi:hypothetical protein